MDLLLIVVLIALMGFMFWNSRKRMQKAKAEQEEKSRRTLPGAEVLLQGGLYGTIVEYDGEDLDKPALVEIAPGTVIRVHSQAILRVVDPTEGRVSEDELIEAEVSEAQYIAGVVDGDITSISDDHKRHAAESDVEFEKKKNHPGV